MADTLSLQGLEVDETPADTYQSTNSVYTCARMSFLSFAC